MSWTLKAKKDSDAGHEEVIFHYDDETFARKGYEAMLRNGYVDVTLEEVE